LQIRASRQRLEQSFDFALDQIADSAEVVRRAIFEGGSAPNAFGDDAKSIAEGARIYSDIAVRPLDSSE
jgi:hypothetical protein